MQNVYSDQCYDWFKRFKDSRMSVDDGPRSGCLLTSIDEFYVTKVIKSRVLIRRFKL